MKFRFHRGSLEDSLATVVEVGSMAELRAVIEKEWGLICPTGDEPLSVEPYGYDARIDWDTHLVLWKYQPVGFLNGPLS
jgi:hypothetical protein